MAIGDQNLIAVCPDSGRPLVTTADLAGFVYAYPICGLAKRFPVSTSWAVSTVVAPFYRQMRRADQARVAEQMSRALEIPRADAELLSVQWMRHRIRRACYDLATLSGTAPSIRGNVTGREHLERAVNAGRGAVLVLMHTFAILPAKHLLRRMGFPIMAVRRFGTPPMGRLAQRWLAPRLLRLAEKMAADSDAISADDPGCALRICQWLRDGAIVSLAPDVRGSGTSQVVRFLNGRRPISGGILEIARLCRCPVLPLTAAYSDDGVDVEIGGPGAWIFRRWSMSWSVRSARIRTSGKNGWSL